MIIDNDRGVDTGSNKSLDDGVKVCLKRGGRVTDRDPHVNQARVLLLQTLDCFAQSLHLLDLYLLLLLADGHVLQLVSVLFSSVLTTPKFFPGYSSP